MNTAAFMWQMWQSYYSNEEQLLQAIAANCGTTGQSIL
jgi:hypothetical protein